MRIADNITRRSFVKLTAAVGAAAALAETSAVTGRALADTAVDGSTDDVQVVRSCCRACGKMECGCFVTVTNGRVTKIEGDPSAFQSLGNCCAKSMASIQAAYHPDRLHYPMKRTNPKGDKDPGWVRITWDEAMESIGKAFKDNAEKYGPEAAFAMVGTSRFWCMGGATSTRQTLGTPNNITAWQICKGPRAFATEVIDEYASYWMATCEHPRVYVQWGGASEISNYDDSGRMTVDVAKAADKHIIVDPRVTNLGKEADIHLPLLPGTDGAMAAAWIDTIIEEDLYDDLYVKRWTNAPFLVCDDIEPSGYDCSTNFNGVYNMKTRLLKESDLKEGGSPYKFIVYDNLNDRFTYFDAEGTGLWEGETWNGKVKFHKQTENIAPGAVAGRIPETSEFSPAKDPALYGEFEVTLKNGKKTTVVPVWQKFAEKMHKFNADAAAEICQVPAEKIREAARTYATRIDPSTGYGNGGIQYMLAIEHACNATDNVRLLDILTCITGNGDTPGGNRGGTSGLVSRDPGMTNRALPRPDDAMMEKILGADQLPMLRWWRYWAHGPAVYEAILNSNPYPVRAGINQSGDMLAQSNTSKNWEALKSLDFFVQVDMWHAPTSDAADIILPCTHWLEIDAARMSQGSHGAMGATCAVIDPPGECKYDVEFSILLAKAMGKPWNPDPSDPWPDAEWERDQTVSTIGMTWKEYREYFQEHGWLDCKEWCPETWGTYKRYESGAYRLPQKVGWGATGQGEDIPLPGFKTPTHKQEIWSTVIETYHPGEDGEIPGWNPGPFTSLADPALAEEYPFLATTGRRIPVYFHSEHRQLPWCRELWPVPRMEINPADAEKLGVTQGDWVWIETKFGKIRETVDLYNGIREGVVNLEHQWWFPEIDESGHGFEHSAVNQLISPDACDKFQGATNLRAYQVKIYKATPENSPFGNPCPCDSNGVPIITDASDPRLKDWLPDYTRGRE